MKRRRNYTMAYPKKAAATAFGRKVQRARLQMMTSPMALAGSSSPFYGRVAGSDAERKFLDVTIADNSISAGGDIQNSGTLVVIPQGAGESERVGRKVIIRKMMFRGDITLNEYAGTVEADASAANRVRVIFYLDKQCNGAAAVTADILAVATPVSNGFNNLTNRDRFVILKDKFIDLNPMALAKATTNFVRPRVNKSMFFAKSCDIPVEYSGTAGTIGEIRSNNIGCLLLADSAAAGFPCTVTGTVRFRYTDQ